jgi:hypothetical protein
VLEVFGASTRNHQEATMSVTTSERATSATAVRPFTVDVPQAEIDALRARVAATRWPDKETVDDRSQGVRLAKLRPLVEYWGTGYDWRKVEARLNALPQFMTEIDGLDIQFAHVRSPHDDALPLLMTHGWPGSIIELMKGIEPLTNPTAHGGRAEDASTSSCRRCPATASRASRRRPAGVRPGWRPRSTS